MLIRALLAEDGSLYLHLDSHLGHYAKVILDEVFGAERFQSEIVWKRTSAHSSAQRYGPVHDSLFYYTASDNSPWTDVRADYDEAYLDKYYRFDDGDGRLYWRADLCAAGVRTGKSGLSWRGIDPSKKGMHWKFGVDTLEELDAAGRIYWPPKGTMPQYKRYRDELKGKSLSDVWDDVDRINPVGSERLGYPTQKPEALLERIIRASSNEDDLVLDCFCGSGTTPAVAEKLGRRWIAADLGRFAIHTTRKRLLSIDNLKPFVVQNLGKYERQAWQVAEFANGDQRESAAAQLAYRRFMLDLYRAQPLDGYAWLHGVRDGRLVHVGGVDAPVSQGDVRGIVQEFWKVRSGSAAVNAVDVLGWDFAFELHEVATQMAAEANVHLRFKRIPREVLEKKAVEQGDIKFFELAALSVAVSQADHEGLSSEERAHGPHVTITLTDFTVPPDEVPDDVVRAVSHWSQWIDYWAVDWDYRGDAFHNMAQTYRTRKDPQLQKHLAHTYDQPGAYTVVVKVIDILGNDTTKSLSVEVR